MSLITEVKNTLTQSPNGLSSTSIYDWEIPNGVTLPAYRVVFADKDKPVKFFGDNKVDIETFKIIIRGSSHSNIETNVEFVKTRLQGAGFIQIGGYETVEPKEQGSFAQIAISFKAIR